MQDLKAFCRKHPEVLKLIKREIRRAHSHAEAGAKGGRGVKANDNIISFNGRGTGEDYTIARLKGIRPDLCAQASLADAPACSPAFLDAPSC